MCLKILMFKIIVLVVKNLAILIPFVLAGSSVSKADGSQNIVSQPSGNERCVYIGLASCYI